MKIIDTIQEASPRVKARIAGLFDLLEALTSGLGQVIIPGMLIVSGNAAATAANVLAHGPLFRLSILLALLGVACHIAWTYLFYELFKAVNRNLSLLAVFFSLVAMALQAFSSTLQAAPLVILEGGLQYLLGILWILVRVDWLPYCQVHFYASNPRRIGGARGFVLAYIYLATACSLCIPL